MTGLGRGERWERAVRLVVGAVVLLTAMVGMPERSGSTPGAATRPAAASAAAPGAGVGTWVTLVTGDRVLVGQPAPGEAGIGSSPGGILEVAPGAGRDDVAIRTYIRDGDTYVLPLDAQPLLDGGRLDERLFNVSALIRFGYDDRSRPDLPLIVSGSNDERAEQAVSDAAARAADDTGGTEDTEGTTITRPLPSVDAVAVEQAKAQATAVWKAITGASPEARAAGELAPGLTRVWLDGTVQATLDQSVPQIGAPTAWEAGHTGEGVEVAVLDTGLDPVHPDLADAVVAARDFTVEDGEDSTRDGHGHGTHVASIVTGSGQAAGGRYAGVAPDARLLVGKVLDDGGGGYESEIIAGMEWAAGEGASVVNMSLGTSGSSGDGLAPMDQAIDRLTEATGTLFVVAAGNDGPDPRSVNSPGSADAALTVGAVDDQDRVTEFSSRGPRAGRPAMKPEITAPGDGIVAARAAGTSLGSPVDDSYTSLSGTSMATPHVAGAAAILAGQHPDWTAEQLRAVLLGSASPQDGATVYDQGAGRVDVARAVTQPVRATPAAVHTGVAAWPHDDDEPVATPVTYRNDGAAPLTLDLSADVRDAGGAAAPAGMVTVSPGSLTVPAGGEATADVTVDTTMPGPDGQYGGLLTATGATGDGQPVAVQTPVGFDKEVESYDVTIEAHDRNGAEPDYWGVRFIGLEGQGEPGPRELPSGEVVARVPKGTYFLEGWAQTVLSETRSGMSSR